MLHFARNTAPTGFRTIHHAVRINSFCKHTILLDGETKVHLLVSLSWYKYHLKHAECGKPVTIWYHDLFESVGIHSLLPVHFLVSRSVCLLDKLDDESVLFLCPCIE